MPPAVTWYVFSIAPRFMIIISITHRHADPNESIILHLNRVSLCVSVRFPGQKCSFAIFITVADRSPEIISHIIGYEPCCVREKTHAQNWTLLRQQYCFLENLACSGCLRHFGPVLNDRREISSFFRGPARSFDGQAEPYYLLLLYRLLFFLSCSKWFFLQTLVLVILYLHVFVKQEV